MLLVARRNSAPTAQHATHHLYALHLDRASATPFVFSESIGGGHGERGGSIALGLNDLERWAGEWREHVRLAGAPQLVAMIETALAAGSQADLVEHLFREAVRERAS
ncbi:MULTISPECIES: hypothetical protein [unclassified Pseudomonas]|uniref:hypothetical protein n=1 Tax=unclassified Pseudomonas TaxID=196821 RepID=UPI0024486B71|nr:MULTISPECIES: hypothetical protein [unclassified Pseudomonas]MDH0897441.1 hypothetical protein [Pseudomonas sp. GD03875]MDH1067616.1 hypothetical protein [Pseudomonas sp. GD03985]